ncbi:MAG TPA: hypothetical protein VFF00_09690, partial [Candidatus Elarobacter sp.]|nr:hypothetical protein [Candidatus Elarobacter sp.]
MPEAALAPSLVRALPASSRPLAELIERLRTPLGARGLAFGLHETTSSARPYLLAALHNALKGQIFVVVPTTDVAERTFTDLTYYLGEHAASTVALLRAREETLGALESPSERSARMTLLADLCARKPQVIVAPVAALRAYLAGGADVPEPWLALAYDERATVVDYLHEDALLVLEEPGMLETVEHGLDDERARGAEVLQAGVDSGELDVRD